MPANTGRLNPGIEYQFKVITYTAICLSENEDVEDFVIYTNKEEVLGFDDIIAKVWYKNESTPFLYLGQIKHRLDKINLNNKANNINKYRDDIKDIFAKKETPPFLKELFTNVPDENVEFWFFCSKSVVNTRENNPIEVDGTSYDVVSDGSYKSIFSFSKDAGCYKLIPYDNTDGSSDFDRLYLLLDQPDNNTINEDILKCNEVAYTKETVTQIVAYTTEYFQTPIASRGLRKDTFETQLLRLCLSPVTIPPTEVIEIHDDLAWIWNELNLEHDVTVIDQSDIDMKPYLFGIVFEVLKRTLNNAEFNWNSCVGNSNKLPANFNIQKFLELTKAFKTHHLLKKPDVLDVLLVEMWKYGFIPLILSSDCKISILKKFRHLKKKFILLNNNYKLSDEIRASGLSIFANLSDIQNGYLRRKLLEGIDVSLQGREPVKFAKIVNDHKNIMKEIRCSHMLNLIKRTYKIFVKKEFLEQNTSNVFIISHSSKNSKEVSDDWKSSLGVSLKSTFKEENVIINCLSADVEKYIAHVKNHSILKDYSRYHLNREHPSRRLEYLAGDVVKIKHFLIDEIGNEIYFHGGKLTPIIGTRLCNEEEEDDSYIPRDLRKAIIKHSFLDFEEERILLLTGDVDSLEVDIRKKIIKEFYGDIKAQIEKTLKEKKCAIVVVENENVEEYWSMFPSNKYPIFHIEVDNGALVLLKYKNYKNLTSYITYEGKKFQDKSFFEETLNGLSIIIGEAGLGKTRLLHFLFEKYSKHNYVLFCDLVDYLNELRKGNKSELMKKSLKYILSRSEHSIPSNALLPNGFFNSLCEFHHTTNRLLLIMDSFDEVLRLHKKEVLELLKRITNGNIRIIIACRPITGSILINSFDVQPIRIEYLDKDSATKYLRSTNLTNAQIESIPKEFLGNLFYLKLLNILPKDTFPTCNVNNKFNLYKTVIENIVERFCKKKRDANNSPHQSEDIMKMYKLFALASLFGKEVIEDQEIDYDELVEDCTGTNKIELGIIVGFDDDIPIFIRRTIAEFLVALWIFENFDTIPAQDIYKRLLDSNHRTIRFLLDNHVCENLKLHQAILREDLPLIEVLCEENKGYLGDTDEYNRTPLHLAAGYCIERTNDCNFSESSLKYKILETIVRRMNKEKCNFNRRDMLMKWTWLEYIKRSKNCFEILCRYGLSATLEKYLSTRRKMINERDIENALNNDQLQIAVVLLKHCPSLIKKYFDKTVQHCLKVHLLDPVLNLIELQNCEDEEFNTFQKICQNVLPITTIQNFVNFKISGEFTSLHLACMYGNLEIVRQLVTLEENLYRFDKFQNIPLHYAVMQNSSEIVSELIKHMSQGNSNNYYLNITNSFGRTPLHEASMEDNQDVVQILILNGASIDCCDENGSTSLHFATLYGHTSILKILLENGGNVNTTDSSNNTVLHYAVQVGNMDLLHLLLGQDVDVNIKGHNGNTALHNAVFYEQINVLKLLIEKGANTSIQNGSGNAVLHSAVAIGSTEIVEVLLNSGVCADSIGHIGRTPLHMAAYNGQTDIFKILLDKCTDVNARDALGNTILHCAVQSGDLDMVQLLLQKGADVNLEGSYGNTPLHSAVLLEQTHLFEILLDNGADVNIRNDMNVTVLQSACAKKKIDLIQVLLKKGVDVNLKDHSINTRDNNDSTSLHIATEKGDITTRDTVNLRGSGGNTPLSNAAYKGQTDTVALLLENEADLNIRNDNNKAPSDLAAQESKLGAIEILNIKIAEKDESEA